MDVDSDLSPKCPRCGLYDAPLPDVSPDAPTQEVETKLVIQAATEEDAWRIAAHLCSSMHGQADASERPGRATLRLSPTMRSVRGGSKTNSRTDMATGHLTKD